MISFTGSNGVLGIGENFPHSRRRHTATFCGLFGTLFHHAPATPLPVCTIPISMVEPTFLAALVPKTALAEIAPPCFRTALQRAIAVTTVTAPTKEKELPTAHRLTNYVPKRLHIPKPGTGENLVDRRGSCDLPKHDPRPGRRRLGVASTGPPLFWRPSDRDLS